MLKKLSTVHGHVSRSECRMKSQINNSAFERVEEFKYSGTNLTNQNCYLGPRERRGNRGVEKTT